LYERNVQCSKTIKFFLKNGFEQFSHLLVERRFSIVGMKYAQKFGVPFRLIVDLHIDVRSKRSFRMFEWHRHPGVGSLISLQLVTIAHASFGKLHIIQKNKHVRLFDLIKISQPGKKIGLMNTNNHYTMDL